MPADAYVSSKHPTRLTMIPKIIHYCWFGGGKLPDDALKCIESWRKHCPDYEIMAWDETNFDIDCLPYVREAYDARKYAFVSDVARLMAIHKHGGVYMDTDMELLRGIDCFLHQESFCGFEDDSSINAAILGARPGAAWIGRLIESYKERHFIKPNGIPDVTTIVTVMTDLLAGMGIRRDGTMQNLPGKVTVYPKQYFYPKSYATGETVMTADTYGIHHCVASWVYQQNPQYRALSKKYHWIPKFIRRHFILTYMGERKAPLTASLINAYRKFTGHKNA